MPTASQFYGIRMKIVAGDCADLENADVVVITTGANQLGNLEAV